MTEETMPDPGPGWEWYREHGDYDGPRGIQRPTLSLPRNGLPEPGKPYVYHGTGTDQYLGTYGGDLESPYWDGQP